MRDLTVTLRNTTTGRLTRLPIAARNPGIIDPPAVMKVADAPADGERDVPVTVSGDVNAVAHGLARPVVTPRPRDRRVASTTSRGGRCASTRTRAA